MSERLDLPLATSGAPARLSRRRPPVARSGPRRPCPAYRAALEISFARLSVIGRIREALPRAH